MPSWQVLVIIDYRWMLLRGKDEEVAIATDAFESMGMKDGL